MHTIQPNGSEGPHLDHSLLIAEIRLIRKQSTINLCLSDDVDERSKHDLVIIKSYLTTLNHQFSSVSIFILYYCYKKSALWFKILCGCVVGLVDDVIFKNY